MEDTLVTFQTAKLAKEKGFIGKLFVEDWYNSEGHLYRDCKSCFFDRDIYIEAPTQSLLQKWLREEHGIHIILIPTITSDWTYKTTTVISERDNDVILGIKSVGDLPPYEGVFGEDFSTYEATLENALQAALKLITC